MIAANMQQMNCPHCKEEISDSEIAKHLGAKGGGLRDVDYSKVSQARKVKKGWPKGKPRKPKPPAKL